MQSPKTRENRRTRCEMRLEEEVKGAVELIPEIIIEQMEGVKGVQNAGNFTSFKPKQAPADAYVEQIAVDGVCQTAGFKHSQNPRFIVKPVRNVSSSDISMVSGDNQSDHRQPTPLSVSYQPDPLFCLYSSDQDHMSSDEFQEGYGQ